jgi:hypothetical protein
MHTQFSLATRSFLLFSFAWLFLVLVLAVSVWGQSATNPIPKPASFDGTTPPSLAPGSAAGSYALSGFDSVNLYSRQLSFALPLMKIGGRGESGFTMHLPYEAPAWQVRQAAAKSCTYVAGNLNCVYSSFTNYALDSWSNKRPGYGAGLMLMRQLVSKS